MEEYPIYAEIGNELYEINTSYTIAVECIDVINNYDYSEEERALLVIALLYKDWEKIPQNEYNKACEIAVKYLLCGKKMKSDNKDEKDMDYKQDMNYIKVSFMSVYHLNLDDNGNMHWYEFHNLCNGLTEKCILNRIRDVRAQDLHEIKDKKQRARIEKLQEFFALEKRLTKEEKEMQEKYNEIFGITEDDD